MPPRPNLNTGKNLRRTSAGRKGGLCATLIIITGMVLSITALAASPKKDLNPLTREEFSEVIFLGMPEKKLTETLGPPDASEANKDPMFSNLLYRNRIIDRSRNALEDVVVVIFGDYRNVHEIIWADGSSVKR